MNNRRSFLRLLGIGAVAAPAVVKAAQFVTEASPLVEVSWSVDNGESYVSAIRIKAAQREINRRWAAVLDRAQEQFEQRRLAGLEELPCSEQS